MTLLDTDIFSLAASGHPRVSTRIQTHAKVVVSIVTRIEALQGRFDSILKANDGKQLLVAGQRLIATEFLLSRFELIDVDTTAAQIFDHLRQDRKLRKIGRADLLIASIALANQATLVTRNVRHFQLVPGLKIENWAD